MLFRVNRGSFMPSPNVDSAVIRLDIKPDSGLDVADEKLFFRIIRAAFSQRRKQIINPLSAELKQDKQQLSELFEKSGIKQTARAEELTLQDYARLCNAVCKK